MKRCVQTFDWYNIYLNVQYLSIRLCNVFHSLLLITIIHLSNCIFCVIYTQFPNCGTNKHSYLVFCIAINLLFVCSGK